MSEKDSEPTLRGHQGVSSLGLRQKSSFAQPITYSGRGAGPAEGEITQNSRRSPVCRSRSTQERSNDGGNDSPPRFAATKDFIL